MAKLWKGRFSAPTHPLLERFSVSLDFDRELAEVDIRGSLAHAEMLTAVGLLSRKDLQAIRRGLREILASIRDGTFVFRTEDEDIHMAIEGALIAKIGEPGKRLHTARSRNDQVATDLRLWTRDAIDAIDTLIASLQRALVELADREREGVIPGYTHLQPAQPVLLAQHLLAYVEMLARDRERLLDARHRVNHLPLGSCALAGTTLPIDRYAVMRALGFEALCENSMDAVSDRDFVIELLASLAILFVHLSRFAEDIILWASAEWGLVVLDDAWSTGSSIMPQKRNPDLLELTRGKTGRVVGALVSLLTMMKGLPLTYNRDLQEDKEPLFDAVRTAKITLACLAAFVSTLTFRWERAREMLKKGFLDATVFAEYLVEKGLPFREAHEKVGQLVRKAEEQGVGLSDLSLETLREVAPLVDADVYARLTPEKTPHYYRSVGSAGTREVAKALRRWKKRLGLSRAR